MIAARSKNQVPLPPFGDIPEEDAFFAKGFLNMVNKPGGEKKFTLLMIGITAPDWEPADDYNVHAQPSGIGKIELKRNGVRTWGQVRAYLLLPENSGRHLGKKSIVRLLKFGRLW